MLSCSARKRPRFIILVLLSFLISLFLCPCALAADSSDTEHLKLKRTQTTDNSRFSAANMFPGDQVTKNFCIQVKFKDAVDLHFRADVLPGSEKMAEVFKVKISVDGEEKYDGLMKDAAVSCPTAPNWLGTDEVDFTITAYLDTSVGSEYQNKSLRADFVWWFTAEDEVLPEPEPPTPDDPTPETYTVSYQYAGDVPENAPALPSPASYLPGAKVSVAASASVDGYTFTWQSTDVTFPDGTFEMPNKDVLIIGTWAKQTDPTPPVDPVDPVDPPVDPSDPSDPGDEPHTGVDLLAETVLDSSILWIVLLAAAAAVIVSVRLKKEKSDAR